MLLAQVFRERVQPEFYRVSPKLTQTSSCFQITDFNAQQISHLYLHFCRLAGRKGYLTQQVCSGRRAVTVTVGVAFTVGVCDDHVFLTHSDPSLLPWETKVFPFFSCFQGTTNVYNSCIGVDVDGGKGRMGRYLRVTDGALLLPWG